MTLSERINDKGWASDPPNTHEVEKVLTSKGPLYYVNGTKFLIIQGWYRDYILSDTFEHKEILLNRGEKKKKKK